MDYNLIEENATFNNNYKLISKLRIYRNSLKDTTEIEKIDFEILFFQIQFEQCIAKDSYASRINESICSIDSYSRECFDYLKTRLSNSKSEDVKLIYNLILWNSKEKDFIYAKNAIDLFITIIEKKLIIYDYYDYLDNAISLIIQTKYKIEKIISLCDKIFKSKTTDSALLKFLLLEKTAKNKFFKKDFFLDKENTLDDIFDYFESITNILQVNELLSLAIKISSKISLNPNKWMIRAGKIYEKHADSKINDSRPFISYSSYDEAKKLYKKGKSYIDEKRVDGQLMSLKGRQLLDNVNIPYDKELVNSASKINENHIQEILNLDSKSIFQYIITNRNLIPSPSNINENTITPFSQFITKEIKFDINKNLKHSKGQDSDFNSNNLRTYKLFLDLFTLPLLRGIFLNGNEKGKVNFAAINKYLIHSSWLGLVIKEIDTGGNPIEYQMIGLLQQGLYSFFTEIETWFITKKMYAPSFQLSIENLSLKFEGLLRKIVSFQGESTTTIKRDEIREKNLEDLISTESIINLFPESDILLFKYVFTKRGINLRNNIAHCYYNTPNQYTIDKALLIIICILKISNLKIENSAPNKRYT